MKNLELRYRALLSQKKKLNEATLPKEYQQVKYLQSNGTAQIHTDIVINEKLVIEGQVEMLTAKNCRNGSTMLNIFTDGNRFYIGVNAGTVAQSFSDNWEGEKEFIVDFPQTITTINEKVYGMASRLPLSDNTTLFYLFVRSNIGNPGNANQRWFYLKAKNDSGEWNLVPCYRKSDNVAGMYDLANGVFYTNAGTGEFILGEEV